MTVPVAAAVMAALAVVALAGCDTSDYPPPPTSPADTVGITPDKQVPAVDVLEQARERGSSR